MNRDTPVNIPANSMAKKISDVHARPSRLLFDDAKSVWSVPKARRVVASCFE
jgi:hypothetical protein|tara:strand:+ start:1131 stop:1286 length:156 start_codon:yes stop_codon:yes gene_type:complete